MAVSTVAPRPVPADRNSDCDAPRAARSGQWIAGLAVAAVLVPNLLRVDADPDLWGHLLFGQTAMEQGLAHVDPYSYTADGSAWTNHEWLTEWTFGAVYAAAGAAGLVWLRAALLLAATACLGAIAVRRRVAPLAIMALAAFYLPVLAQLYRVRPQMFTYTLMAALLLLCDLHRPGRRWALACIPPLIALWTNLHAGFVAGLGIFGVHWLGFAAEAWRRPDRRREWAFLGAILAASIGATALNPYGIAYWEFVFYAVTLPRPAITEWQSIFHQNGTVICCYLAAVLAPACVWFRGRRSGAWSETAAFALGVILAAQHARHLPFLLLFGAVLLARRLPEFLERDGRRLFGPPHAARPLKFLTGTLLVPGILIVGIGKSVREIRAIPSEGAVVVSPVDYPIQAVDFLIRNGIHGNVDGGFTWGEYCIFKLHPQSHVFCDGRYETVYPRRVSELALDAGNDPNVWRERIDGFGTEIILAPADAPFSAWLAERSDFAEIYADATARVFVRRTERFAAVIAAHQQGRLHPPTRPRRPQAFPA